MNTAAIATKVEPKIIKAAKCVSDTASQYLSRDAILPEIKQADNSWKYFSPCTLIESIKPSNTGNVLDFMF